MRLAIVVPCYNEEKVLAESARRLTGILQTLMEKKKVAENSFVLFVNDGSKDKTWSLIEELFLRIEPGIESRPSERLAGRAHERKRHL